MEFGRHPLDKPKTRTIDEVLKSLDEGKEHKTKKLKFELVKDCGLEADADVSFETHGAHKMNTIRISDRGVISHFLITRNGVELTNAESLNDDNVFTLEDGIVANHKQILTDYFSNHPEDIPE